MGYPSVVTGEITIDPPIAWADLKDSWFLMADHQSDRSVRIEVEEEERDTADGTVTVKRGVAIVPAWEDAFSYYTLADDLAALASEFGLTSARTTGHLIRDGESSGDVERLSIGEDGNVISEKAVMTWPDGSTVKL